MMKAAILIASVHKNLGVDADIGILLAISRSFVLVLSTTPFCSGIWGFVSCFSIPASSQNFLISMERNLPLQ